MRELKFRLHDKEGNIIGYETHEINNHGLIQIYHETVVGSFSKDVKKGLVRESYYLNHFFKCQFTGLKDKNGVEIYEWDIIPMDFTIEQFNSHTIKGNTGIINGVVEWNEKGCRYIIKYPESNKHNIIHTEFGWSIQFEVIGNLHQHPNLLK